MRPSELMIGGAALAIELTTIVFQHYAWRESELAGDVVESSAAGDCRRLRGIRP
jgi:hypothetical protein